MEQNYCGHLGFSIDKSLACFDPDVILLLKSKFRLKDLRRDFKMAAILDFLSAHLAVLCLISVLMLIIKFRFNWIIEEISKI